MLPLQPVAASGVWQQPALPAAGTLAEHLGHLLGTLDSLPAWLLAAKLSEWNQGFAVVNLMPKPLYGTPGCPSQLLRGAQTSVSNRGCFSP